MKRDWLFLHYISWPLALPLIAALLILHQTPIPRQIDAWMYDALITAFPAKPAQDTVLVAIDEQSLAALGKWPWPRSRHADLVRKLHQAGADTIVFDVLFPEASADDTDFAAAMTNHGQVVLALHLWPGASDRLIAEVWPAEALRAAAALGHAHVELDTDGLARGLYLYNGLGDRLWPGLALAAHQVSQTGSAPVTRGNAEAAAFVNVRRDFVAVPFAGPSGSIPAYSFSDILESEPAPELFSGKTVFIGATARGFAEALPTPFSGQAHAMSGAEFHANAYSAIRFDQVVTRLDGAINWWLPIAIILLLAPSLPRLYPFQTLILCAGLAGALALALVSGLFIWRLHLPVAAALLMPVIAFPLWTAQRLALTNRFLDRQLDDLGRSRQLNLSQPAQQHPLQLVEHLRSLLQAQGWFLSEETHVLTADGLSADDIPFLPGSGRWVHSHTQSWVRLFTHQKEYLLGLNLTKDSVNQAANQRYLEHLALDSPPEATRPAAIREKIRARIERVRQATQRMNSMHAFIDRSFERMPDGIIVTNALGIIQFTNSHVEEWLGAPRSSVNGMPLTRLLHGHDPRDTPPWHETIAETLTLNQSRTVDLRLQGKDFLIHFAPFDLPESRQSGIIANISDISELKSQQRQHREAIDFISHDVRSPLVSQLALIAQLKRSPQAIEPAQLDQLGRLARRSYNLAEEFVQLARAEQLTETRFYECEFLAIAENARDSVSEQAAEKGIAIQLQGDNDVWVNGNAELLERAIINLLTNAVQYSGGGSTVTMQMFEAGHQVCLTVTDEGNGIIPDELPYLFDRYQRQKSSELDGSHGAGLGLSFVNVVVEKHRGEISVDSTPGVGSTFMVKLPLANPL
ncbi:MAG: CHASE2 domain-containing protein [Oleiphilaceae bacterium]|nr:CHASE2 domain-containing protein [Oleiphilaceae bacterium]